MDSWIEKHRIAIGFVFGLIYIVWQLHDFPADSLEIFVHSCCSGFGIVYMIILVVLGTRMPLGFITVPLCAFLFYFGILRDSTLCQVGSDGAHISLQYIPWYLFHPDSFWAVPILSIGFIIACKMGIRAMKE